jgi:hypothetical protein
MIDRLADYHERPAASGPRVNSGSRSSGYGAPFEHSRSTVLNAMFAISGGIIAIIILLFWLTANAGAQETLRAADLEGKWLGSDGREYTFAILPDENVTLGIVGVESEPIRDVKLSPIRIYFTGVEILKGLEYRGKFDPAGFQVSARFESAENFDARFDKTIVQKLLADRPDFSSRIDIRQTDRSRIDIKRHFTRIGWSGQGATLKLLETDEQFISEDVILTRDGKIPDPDGPAANANAGTELVREDLTSGGYRFTRKNKHGLLVFDEQYRMDNSVLYSMTINRFYNDGLEPAEVSETYFGEDGSETIETIQFREGGIPFKKEDIHIMKGDPVGIHISYRWNPDTKKWEEVR